MAQMRNSAHRKRASCTAESRGREMSKLLYQTTNEERSEKKSIEREEGMKRDEQVLTRGKSTEISERYCRENRENKEKRVKRRKRVTLAAKSEE